MGRMDIRRKDRGMRGTDIYTRASKEQVQAIKAMAAALGVKETQVIRWAIDEAVRGKWTPLASEEGDKVRELSHADDLTAQDSVAVPIESGPRYGRRLYKVEAAKDD